MTGERSGRPSEDVMCLIDGTALAYRSYYAFIRRPLFNSKGENVSAVFGFASSLLKLMDDLKPRYVAVVFDTPGPTFRHEAYADYKATRPDMPDDMQDQLPRIREFVDVLRIPSIELPGYEADDVMGTLAMRARESGIRTVLVTGDKDFFQLVANDVTVFDPGKGVTYGAGEVAETFGVPPSQVTEVMGLMGDSSDNVPGVPGVGRKTATELIQRFGTIEEVLAHIDEISGKKRRENLEEYADQALMSRDLVTLDLDAPVGVELADLAAVPPDACGVVRMFKELELPSLIQRFLPEGGGDDDVDYRLVDTKKTMNEVAKNMRTPSGFAFDLETTSLDPLSAEIVGVSVSNQEGTAFYIPVGHAEGRGLDRDYVLKKMRVLLEDTSVPKYGQNLKYDSEVLMTHGIELRGPIVDSMIASYVLDPSRRQHGLASLALDFLDRKVRLIETLIGKRGPKQLSFAEVSVDDARDYACEDSDLALRLALLLKDRVEEAGLTDLLLEVEMPLVRVLAKMELAGVALDVKLLKRLSKRLGEEISSLEDSIYDHAGCTFNLESPKQVGQVLFEKLKLPRGRRTKTGYSTDVSVLEGLKGTHAVPELLLGHRQLIKLKSGYLDALPALVRPDTGRVHTSFNQTVASTGRLSSSDPNLQNIPTRTEMGREIRKAFVSESGRLLLSADYSQIELRIMAHLSGDENLKQAYNLGEDVHLKTASLIFGLAEHDVTPEQRDWAKTVNFGIMYGMSPFGLSRQLEIPTGEASEFIELYFRTYPGVAEYTERAIDEARRSGHATTILGRRRPIGGIDSDNTRIRRLAERASVNTPIQGSAADIIKLSMLAIDEELERSGAPALMVLQVHDELVFEVDEDAVDDVSEIVTRHMERPPGVELSVPLVVNIKHGKNWYEAH